MQLFWFFTRIFLILNSVCYANVILSDRNARSIFDKECGAVTKGGVKCVSRTHFVMAFQDPVADPPVQCPPNHVCTSFEEMCSTTKEAACTNEVPGAVGVCNMCPPNKFYNPVCINVHEYGFCIRKNMQPSLTYKCKPPKPFCKAIFNNSYPPRLIGICTESPEVTDCPFGRVNKTQIATDSETSQKEINKWG